MSPKIVKRYANRKLYDTERSCYVTLEDIALMIRAGDEVRVIDNKNGEDLTSVTLAQIIFETEKKNSFMPLGLLRSLIQDKGETLIGSYRDIKDTAQQRAFDLRSKLGGTIEDQVDSMKDLVTSSQKAFDELQKGVEERVKGGVGVISRELEQLRSRLSELEERLGKDEGADRGSDQPQQ